MPESVGIRQLQQNASKVVARAKAGEVIDITEHGRVVARLGPIPRSKLQELVDAGLATPAIGSIRDMGSPIQLSELGPGPTPSEELDRMRAEER